MIKLKETALIFHKEETHYKFDVEGKEIWVSRHKEVDNELDIYENDVEIIKGQELLTEEEQEEVIELVGDLK